jgi:hypothetical protein
VSGTPVHRDRLDAFTSSPSWPDLKINEICCSVSKTVSKRRTVLLALSSTKQEMNIPVVHDQTHPKVRNDPPHGRQTAVVSIHQRFHEEPRRLRLDSSKMDREPLYEHDDKAIHRRRVDPRKNTHCEDVHVGSANASTRCRGRGGGELHRRNERCWTFVHGQKGAFDMLTSSPGL